jgi:hypothetical protein
LLFCNPFCIIACKDAPIQRANHEALSAVHLFLKQYYNIILGPML